MAVLGIVIATVCVIGSITYGKTNEIMQGQMEVSEYRVSSKIPGRIMEFRVKEGDKVKAGDTLAIIEAPEVMAKKAQAEAVKTAAVALNDKAEAGAREEQIQGAYELWQKAIVNRDIWEKSFKSIASSARRVRRNSPAARRHSCEATDDTHFSDRRSRSICGRYPRLYARSRSKPP